MQQILTKLSLVVVSAFSVTALAAVPVYAEDGISTSTSGSSSLSTGSHKGSSNVATSGTTKTSTSGTEVETENSSSASDDTATGETSGMSEAQLKADFHAKALETIAAKRAAAGSSATKTPELRQKACEARSANLDNRMANYGTQAQRHLDVFNSIFTKVQAFHDSKKLDASNYTTLVATANAKKADATAAVTALQAVDVKIDCTSSDPAATVATVQTAVKNARTALQAYRAAIKDVIVALNAAKTTSTQTGTSTTTNTTTETN